MPKKKEEYPKLTYGKLVKDNPERADLSGDRKEFKKLIGKSTGQKPFDKEK